MALIVEDGTGMSNSESYISVAEADARATAFGNTAWTGTEAAKEQALRRATRYMMQAYRNRWKGIRLERLQALDWPRYGVEVDGYTIDSDIVPAEIKGVCADLAVRALTEDLSPDLERGIVREKVGPLETEYDAYSPQAKRFTAPAGLLSPFLKGSAVSAVLVRV